MSYIMQKWILSNPEDRLGIHTNAYHGLSCWVCTTKKGRKRKVPVCEVAL